MMEQHEVVVIEPGSSSVGASLGPSDAVDGPVVLTGDDALAWVGAVIEAGPTSLIVWPDLDGPLHVFGDGAFDDGSLVVVAAGGVTVDGVDLRPEWCHRDDEWSEAWGREVMRIEADLAAAIDRLCGPPGRAASFLELAGGPIASRSHPWSAPNAANAATFTGPSRSRNIAASPSAARTARRRSTAIAG